jgi:PIN domain nuclease of toxin-antitoxin system
MGQLAVTDTHALIWYATGQKRRLGRDGRRFFDRAEAGEAAIYVPTIALVEACELAHRGRIEFDTTFSAWEEGLFRSGKYIYANLTREVVRVAEALFSIPERGDRLVAATALAMDVPLITRDAEIGAAGVEVIW